MKCIEAELDCATSKVEHLRSALQITKIMYYERQIQNILQIASAHELVERIKPTSSRREDELEAELKKSKADVQKLWANLTDKEIELQGLRREYSYENEV